MITNNNTPRKRNKEASKNAILNAAIKVFSKNSYEKATFKMIEEESGLSEALITKYFGSKRNLAIAVVSKINDDFYITIDNTVKHETLEAEFHALGAQLLHTFNDNATSLAALLALSKEDRSFLDELLKNAELLSPNPERLQKFRDSGEIPQGADFEIIYKRLMALLQSVLFLSLLTLNLPFEQIEGQVKHTVDMFLYGMSDKTVKYFKSRQ